MKYLNLSALLDAYFVRHGRFVSEHPTLVIVTSLICSLGLGVGLINFHWESNVVKLWIPSQSDFARGYAHLWENYPPELRFHSIIFTADNVLRPEYVRQMYRVRKKLENIRVLKKSWTNFCFQVPVVQLSLTSLLSRKKKRSPQPDKDFFDDDFEDKFEELDPSVGYYPDPFCSVVESLPSACFESSILELWAHNGKYDNVSDRSMDLLTQQGILDKLNDHNMSGIFLLEKNFAELLGGVERDSSGRIVSAKAAYVKLIGRMNGKAATQANIDINNAVGEYVDPETLAFESELIKVLTEENLTTDGLNAYVEVARSFNDIATANIFSDVSKVVLGFSIVFTYVVFMLGKCDRIESRIYLSLAGLFSVLLSMVSSYGVCCSLGFAFSPLHNFIPFLLMGLGIDDMFVIVQSWNSFASAVDGADLSHRFGVTLKHAGVAITVTSLTDFIAFAIGGLTVLPALKSFCIYCGVGILFVFLLQATWFVAWMVLDQVLVCSGWPPKAAVIIATGALAAVSIWGNVLLEQKFDPMWFLPKDSYLSQWAVINDRYFPGHGDDTYVFLADVPLPSQLPRLKRLTSNLSMQQDILFGVEAWTDDFEHYYEKHFRQTDGLPFTSLSEDVYRSRLTQFLFSPGGSKYRFIFRFDGNLTCGQPAPDILMSSFKFRHHLFVGGPSQQIPAMNKVKEVVKSANLTGEVFPFSKGYAAWETDEVITHELLRNLLCAFACVFVTTLLLLSDVLSCVLVLFCVFLTLLNVAGLMHFWGLTIDTVSSTNLIICIGVCVDYAAHVAHAFLHTGGSCRSERAQLALSNIGPAVLNGGFSTFLSFILLADSNSHVFETFFKIFFLVVVFALYNGLVLLPVLLSLVGPGKQRELNEDLVQERQTADSDPIELNPLSA